jgi:hypothetical protein
MAAFSSRCRTSRRRSCKIPGLVLLLFGLPALPTALAAEDATYCAFEVVVRKPSGAAAPNVPVTLVQRHEEMYSQANTDARGVARLCDAPLEAVDIAVGSDVCGLVEVHNLQPTWPEIRRVYVTLVDAPCDHFGFPTTCRVLLRIRDEEGKPVRGARFVAKTPEGAGQSVSDVFGRVYRSLATQGKLEGEVTKQSYEPAHIAVECTSDKEMNITLCKRQ